MKPLANLSRLLIALTAAVVVMIALYNVITNPVTTNTRTYTADFTDASGLQPDGDVRVRGVRVGKVESIDLVRRNGQNVASVKMTMENRFGVVPITRLAIKFQALTGVRYIDVSNPAEGYAAADLVTHVPSSMTQPSFDVTALFNGLQPVLDTLSPEEINTFTANAAAFLTGDETGLTPLLDSLNKLTEFVSNRQQVVSTLISNLREIGDTIQRKSKEFTYLLDLIEQPVDGALSVLDDFRKDFLYAEFFNSAARLLKNAGLRNGFNIDDAFDRAASNLDNFFDAFKLVPVMYENIPPPGEDPAGGIQPCTRGAAQLPETMDVLLNGRRVVLCNR